MIVYGSPFRYYQGFGILSELGELFAPLGRTFLIVGDTFVKNMLGEQIIKTLRDAGKKVVWDESFSGECTDSEVKRLQHVYQQEQCDAIIGVGGGKTVDTAKAVCIPVRAPVGLIPTIAASDAPVSHVAIIYSDTHERLRVDTMPYSPWVVLVDTKIIMEAPPRFLAAGIADALATKIETDACRLAGAKNYFASRQPRIAECISDMCWKIMREQGLSAWASVKSKTHSQDLEDVVEAATLLSGIGFESGGCAAAHGTMSALTSLPGSAKYMHGELVAFGIVVQLCMEERSVDFIKDTVDFLQALGLPTDFAGVGLDVRNDTESIEKVIQKACTRPGLLFNMPMEISADMYRKAIYRADELGNQNLMKLTMLPKRDV